MSKTSRRISVRFALPFIAIGFLLTGIQTADAQSARDYKALQGRVAKLEQMVKQLQTQLAKVSRTAGRSSASGASTTALSNRVSAIENAIDIKGNTITIRKDMKLSGRFDLNSNSHVQIKAMSLKLEGQTTTDLKSGTNMTVRSGAQLNLRAGAVADLRGSLVRLGGGNRPVARSGDAVVTSPLSGAGNITIGSPTVLVP